jgi:heme A synthase
LAIIISVYCVLSCWKITPKNSSPIQLKLCKFVTIIVILQIGIGFLNIVLLAPIFMQLIHLLVADLLWIVAILFFNTALSEKQQTSVE